MIDTLSQAAIIFAATSRAVLASPRPPAPYPCLPTAARSLSWRLQSGSLFAPCLPPRGRPLPILAAATRILLQLARCQPHK